MRAGAELVTIDGVEIELDETWASPPIREALRSKWYERAERGILAATLSPDDTYLDLGCGIGLLATLAAKRVGAGNVVGVEADPAIATVARETASRNGQAIDVRNVVLIHDPVETLATFHVRADFWASSLSPPPEVGEDGDPTAEVRRIQVPAVDARETIAGVGASYLMVDIEGGETDLLRQPLPGCVKTVCVDLHAEATGIDAQSEMVASILANGFDLDVGRSDLPALLFRRRNG